MFRILFLGDSCADLGRPPYPEVVERVLNEGRSGGSALAGSSEAAGGRRVESVSLSVVGYTSHQGLVVARRYGALVDPDVVVLHYGWNDHWLAYGGPDHEVADGTAFAAAADALFSSSRLLQFVHAARGRGAVAEEKETETGSAGPADLRHLLGSELRAETRVPAERYRDNLLALAGHFEAMGVPVVFVTPPSAHGALGVPRHFVELRYAVDEAAVTGLHDEYNRIVREVAAASGERLFDLERSLDALSPEQQRRIFLFDGIHYAAPGCRYVGRQVAGYLRAEFDP